MAGKCDPPGSPPTGPPGMPLVRGEDHVLAAGMHVSVSVHTGVCIHIYTPSLAKVKLNELETPGSVSLDPIFSSYKSSSILGISMSS